MKKRELFMFIIFLAIIVLMARKAYIDEAKNKSAINSDVAMCSYMEDVVNKYEDLSQCATWGEEFIDNYDASIQSVFNDPHVNRRFLSLRECCTAYNQGLPLSRDKYDVFFRILDGNLLSQIPIIFSIIILFFALFNINKKIKSKYAYYYIQRKSYRSLIFTIALSAYKYALALPLLYIVVYLFTLNITNHSPIDSVLSLKGVSDYIQFVSVPGFWIFYYLTGFLFGAFIINLGMIFLHRNGKLIFSIFGSLITYFYIAFVDELFLHKNGILFNFFRFDKNYSIYYVLSNMLIYFFLTFIVMIFVYRSKEKTLYALNLKQ